MPRSTIRRDIYACACLCLIAIAGCGSPLPATVEGTVTLDDEPIPPGAVVFYPVAGGAAVHGRVADDGSFTLTTGTTQGLQPGEYTVTVMCRNGQPSMTMTPEQIDALDVTPTRYRNRATSDLRYTIEPGKNEITVALSTAPQ